MDQVSETIKDLMNMSPKEIALDRAIKNDKPTDNCYSSRLKFDTSKKINCLNLNDKFVNQIRIFKDEDKLKSKYMTV